MNGERQALRHPQLLVGGSILLAIATLAVLAPIASPYSPDEQNILLRYQPPGLTHLMGTDGVGRDILSRAIWGGRVSLSIGLISVLISVVISVIVGAVAGFYGGVAGTLLMRFTDMMLVFPPLFLLIAVVSAFGNSVPLLIAILGLTSWQVSARLVRGEILALREREFVLAARAVGADGRRVLVRHILPNVVSVVIIAATIRIPQTIMLEAGLSYLGLGVQPPMASWGNMVADGKGVLTIAWWVSAFPGVFVLLTVLAFNLLGDGLRDALDPRMST
jgi:peptide/nickel transport system permease protein